ncbi:hypothetical protein NE237_012922 [Protea cynaroides]|uniref:Shikimate dehydrogenase (NADP(+)) n=1 Tax=Protea cynaroides TaxID=273540 RepID=A0A9Q0H2U2_9MAGN|nr:hypothetical protein NE237_012922 [Protea cynaroides]
MSNSGTVTNPLMICVPLMGMSVEEMMSQMGQAKSQGADLVEIRLDYIKNFQPRQDLEMLLRDKLLPVIIVFRPKWEGGQYEGDEQSRLDALKLAMELGADYIDVELKVASDLMVNSNLNKHSIGKVIVSCHVGDRTPSKVDLVNLVTKMHSTGADIIKLVTHASHITDLARIFHLLSHCKTPLIAYSTGDRGLISHLLCPKFGGFLIYGSMGNNPIPGLPTLDSLRQAYKLEYLNANTKVFGLISNPVGHSKGPILHNLAFRHVGYNAVYVPMRVDDLKEFFRIYSSPDFAGFSVGIPYKEAITGCCDEVHPLAQSIGAVNTIIRRPSDGKLVGYNTDCEAAITAIEDALGVRRGNNDASFTSPLAGKQFVLAGAGGAGRALAFGAKSRGARIIIFDIDYERARSLAHSVSGEVQPYEDIVKFRPEKGGILANATPLGMHPNTDRIPVAEDTLGVYQLVFDSVYNPRKTRLLKEAEAAGTVAVSGVEMFLRQAIGQFDLFTGGEAPEEFMLNSGGFSLSPTDYLQMSGRGGMGRNPTLICAPIMGQSVDEMLSDIGKANAGGADLVEVRLDYLNSFNPRHDLEILIKQSPLPTLFTYRPKWEGGQYEGDETRRLDALKLAMELGADYIDVELQVAHEFISSIHGRKPQNFKVIVSSHNYQNTPSVENIANLVARIQATGADIVKIATTALDITDVARVFQITFHSQVPIIGLVMGERGLISRFLCPKFGGYLTFGTIEAGKVSAPGQPTLKDLLNIYNFRQLGPDTKVFGIIGNPVGHSKSPILYNEAFKAVGFNGIYVPLLVDDVGKFFDVYASPDFAGFSCTIPHKENALLRCDEVDPVAKAIGAVNCIVKRPSDGKLIGYNTDYVGAITAIEDGLRGSQTANNSSGSPLAGKLFIVIGAGGAGKALAYGAKEKGARVVIANRTLGRAKELAELIGGQAISLAELGNYCPENGMILANTTSIGMQPKVDETPVPKRALSSYSLVFDAVYTPKMTRLLKEAKESGATIVSGVEMFIGQAYEQYERFTNLPAPKRLFREIMARY